MNVIFSDYLTCTIVHTVYLSFASVIYSQKIQVHTRLQIRSRLYVCMCQDPAFQNTESVDPDPDTVTKIMQNFTKKYVK
jgi:hypothetical protein